MIENFFVEFVASTVIGFFGILYHLYGFPLNILGRTYYCEGEGYDFYSLNAMTSSKDGRGLINNDFNHDFLREKIHTYIYKSIRVTKTSSKVYIKGHMIAIEPNGTMRDSDFIGKGELISDSRNIAYVYVKNYRKNKNESVWWNCMYFLRFSATGTIDGYWFTQDTEKNGRFVMGRFTFDRNEDLPKIPR